MRKLISLGSPAVLLIAALALVHHIVFWACDWHFAPSLWWLITLIGGAILFLPAAAWYYFGTSKAPLLALAGTITAVDVGSVAFAGSLDLSKMSYLQGFNAEMAMLFLPPMAYFAVAGISRLMRKPRKSGLA